ncbi:uncharacterized protein FIBRA_00738 [Fibroporia radiculosa]|uniref:Major facilitator superfamily (MFS) profile domain-containing protein n=1 Tax=Fibroporia radiculosa TaxID=599839 RepID=J4G0K7_9APHY|nr:uncharacterized protein FIBRA_00738 [Fibroporia radiculosa]CCL98733.1 predicted protein [Fibroporia radiculosa]
MPLLLLPPSPLHPHYPTLCSPTLRPSPFHSLSGVGPRAMSVTTLSSSYMSKESTVVEEAGPSTALSEPPDGGIRAWSTVAGAWMVQFSTFGFVIPFPCSRLSSHTVSVDTSVHLASTKTIIQPNFSPNKPLPTSGAVPAQSNVDTLILSPARSWIGSLQLCLMYAPGVLVGRAFDAGYFHHLEIFGSLLYVFCIFMLSLAKPQQYYQVFLSQAVGMGIGLGMTFLPSLSIVSQHFKKRRALAIGIVVSGSSAGGIVFPIMLNYLFLSSRVNFATAVRASGAVVGGLLLVGNCLMRTRPLVKSGTARVKWVEMKDTIWDGAYLWSIAGAFFTSLGVYVPLFYLQLFASDHGVDARITTYCLAIMNAGSILGRLIPPFLADRLGVYNMLLPSIFMCAALIFSMFGATTSAGVILVGLLFGFSSGAYISLIPSLLVSLCNNMGELGIKMGCAYTVVAVAMLTGNPIAGALLGQGHGNSQSLTWWPALVFTGLCALLGLLFVFISRALFVVRKGRQRV